MKISYYFGGAHHTATIEPASGGYSEQIAWGDGYRQDLPPDADDYRFTHGADQYRAACRAAWAARKAQASGATVLGLP